MCVRVWLMKTRPVWRFTVNLWHLLDVAIVGQYTQCYSRDGTADVWVAVCS